MRTLLRTLLPFRMFQLLARAYGRVCCLSEGPGFLFRLASSRRRMSWHFRRLSHSFEFGVSREELEPIIQNIVRGECVGGPLPENVRTFIDAGAFVGDTAAVYLSKYRDSFGIALEPSGFHEMALKNLRPYGNRIVVTKAALAREAGKCSVKEAGTGTKVTPGDEVPTIDMDCLLKKLPGGRADLLKMDIEGSEIEVLRPPTPWIDRVDCIVVELHGDAAARDVPNWLKAAGFRMSRHRSLHFFIRSPLA